MKLLNGNFFIFLLLITFCFGLENCASKKKITTTKKVAIEKNKEDKISNKNILYIVEGKEVSADFIKTISTDKIDSITVYKDTKEVAKYTDKKVDGVIIIKMKKN